MKFDPENPLFDTTSFHSGRTYNDFMIGARYTWNWTDRWGVTLRGDGSSGDTEGTWNASVVGHYRMEHGAWLFGYRYLSAEFQTGAEARKFLARDHEDAKAFLTELGLAK